ncbi:MAG: hypothetical protein EOP87_25695, partial [Verrucomicrobiaceae bacterium]
SRCLFGSGLAEGKDRAAKALRNALASPLLDQGALLKDAQTVLVHLSGGEDLTLYEIELLMQRLQKFVPEKAHVLFGAAIDPAMRDSLSVTLISALPEDHLRTTPRDSLSSSLPENPVLDPSDSFASYVTPAIAATPAIVAPPAAEPAFADIFPVEETKPEPEPEPEPAPAFKQETETKPEPTPEPERHPEPEPVEEAGIWDEEPPFAEAFADSPVEAVASTPAPQPAEQEKPATHLPAASPPKSENVMRLSPETDPNAGKNLWSPKSAHTRVEDEFPPDLDDEPEAATQSSVEPPKLKLGVKSPTAQPELSFDTAPRGRFEGVSPNVVNGEDLDLPPFLRKKK